MATPTRNLRFPGFREKARKSAVLFRRQVTQWATADSSVPTGANVLVYNPYISVLGGGERYTFALAAHLRQRCEVTLASQTLPPLERMRKLEFPTTYVFKEIPLAYFSEVSEDYDAVVNVTTIPPAPSLARQSFLVVQFPERPLDPRLSIRLRQYFGIWSYRRCIVYSDFVGRWLRLRWHRRSTVLHPLIKLGAFDSSPKQNLILSVGRFFASRHCKRQDVLIEAYKMLPRTIRDTWRLVLAGGVADNEEDFAYLKRLQQDAAGHNIEIDIDVPQSRLEELYRRASLFWHATGFGRLTTEPEKAEHFGMTTLEAMSFGAVPMVFPDGGQLEIVTPSVGLFWRTTTELAQLTERLAENPEHRRALARNAAEASKVYGGSHFHQVSADVFG